MEQKVADSANLHWIAVFKNCAKIFNSVQWCCSMKQKSVGCYAKVFKRDQAVAAATARKEGVILYSLINGVQPNNAMYDHTPA